MHAQYHKQHNSLLGKKKKKWTSPYNYTQSESYELNIHVVKKLKQLTCLKHHKMLRPRHECLCLDQPRIVNQTVIINKKRSAKTVSSVRSSTVLHCT